MANQEDEMKRLREDMEAEAITLEADASRIEASLQGADMDERARADTIRLYCEPRRRAASKLREAIYSLNGIVPVGFPPASARD